MWRGVFLRYYKTVYRIRMYPRLVFFLGRIGGILRLYSPAHSSFINPVSGMWCGDYTTGILKVIVVVKSKFVLSLLLSGLYCYYFFVYPPLHRGSIRGQKLTQLLWRDYEVIYNLKTTICVALYTKQVERLNNDLLMAKSVRKPDTLYVFCTMLVNASIIRNWLNNRLVNASII